MGIKNRLVSLMNDRGTNANDLAQQINVRPSTIYSIIQRDSNRIDIDLILKISQALGVTVDELLKEEVLSDDTNSNMTNIKKISSVNERIRSLLDFLGISQADFCKKTGLTKSALSNYLNGVRQPRVDAIVKIADAFNIEPTWLMGYDVPSYPADLMDDSGANKLYSNLIAAARGCSPFQIKLATEVLNSFRTGSCDNDLIGGNVEVLKNGEC